MSHLSEGWQSNKGLEHDGAQWLAPLATVPRGSAQSLGRRTRLSIPALVVYRAGAPRTQAR